jgi:hypothetical protein
LSEAKNPPKTRFIDAYPKVWNTLPVYDITYFHDLAAVFHNELVLEQDKAMMALLASIGIEKGKAFNPVRQPGTINLSNNVNSLP